MQTGVNRRERNNRIINAVMSGKRPIFLLGPSDSVHMDFLPELCNNYRTVVTYDVRFEIGSLISGLARKVFGVGEDFYKIMYCYRNQPQKYQSYLVRYMYSKLQENSNGCLLFICGLEQSFLESNKVVLQNLISLCPENVKFVLASEVFPSISYAFDEKVFPQIIDCRQELEFDGSVLLSDTFTPEQKEFLYEVSTDEFVEGGFADTLFPSGKSLLYALSHNYRSIVLRIGDEYCFHPAVHEILSSALRTEKAPTNIEEEYLKYCERNNRFETMFFCAKKFNLGQYADLALFRLAKIYGIIFTYYFVEKYVGKENLVFKKKLYNEETIHRFDNLNSAEKKLLLYFLLRENNVQYIDVLYKELEKCTDEEFIEYSELFFYLNYTEKVFLGKTGFFCKRSKEIIDSGKYEKQPFFLDFLQNSADVFAVVGQYVITAEIYKKIKELFPLYLFSPIQIWEAGLGIAPGKSFEVKWEKILEFFDGEEENKRMLRVVFALFHGNKKQALESLEHPFSQEHMKSSKHAVLTAFSSMLYAETGKAEFGEIISDFELKRNYDKEIPDCLSVAIAYCKFVEGNRIETVAYLPQREKGKIETVFSFIAEALELNCLTEEYTSQIKQRLGNLFAVCKEKEYGMVVMILRKCFLPLLTMAENMSEMNPYSKELYEGLRKRGDKHTGTKALCIRFFGNATVYAEKTEIVWKTKKCKELFLLYQLHPEGLERNFILSEIWGDYVYSSAINNLKTVNNLIRNTLDSYDIPYTFHYTNGRYSLIAGRVESDYDIYSSIISSDEKCRDINKNVIDLNRLFSLCGDGFIADSEVSAFVKMRTQIQEEMATAVLALIKKFEEKGNYIDARRWVTRLELLNYPDIDKIKKQIDKKVFEV